MTLPLLERLPPHDIEAEEAVLAALLVDPEAIAGVTSILGPTDFFRERNAWVYEAALDLWDRDESVNQITIAHELDRKERLEEAGGQSFLGDIVRQLPTSVGVEFYARIVKRDSTYRGLINAATGILQLAYEAPADLDSVLTRSEDLIPAAARRRELPRLRGTSARSCRPTSKRTRRRRSGANWPPSRRASTTSTTCSAGSSART